MNFLSENVDSSTICFPAENAVAVDKHTSNKIRLLSLYIGGCVGSVRSTMLWTWVNTATAVIFPFIVCSPTIVHPLTGNILIKHFPHLL